jgi:hypothetical protein
MTMLQSRLVDKELAAKMESEEVDYIQFAWRWINCLLLREIPFRLSLRLVRSSSITTRAVQRRCNGTVCQNTV